MDNRNSSVDGYLLELEKMKFVAFSVKFRQCKTSLLLYFRNCGEIKGKTIGKACL